MLKKSLSLLTALIFAGPLLAQSPAPAAVVGKTAEVRGLVTVSVGTNVSTVSGSVPVADGSRFVTASTGFATIRYEDGCEVKLQPNQAYTVENDKPCAARIAAVQAVPGGAGTAVAGSGSARPLVALALFAGGVAVLNSLGGSSGTTATGGAGGSDGGAGGGGVIPNPPPSGQ